MKVTSQTKPIFSPIKLEITLEDESDLFEFRQIFWACVVNSVGVRPQRSKLVHQIIDELDNKGKIG